ncbi:MAG: hypothetical protein R2909_08530 [Gemmatimonadales bacterium]
MPDLIDALTARGLFQECTPGLAAHGSWTISGYVGFDQAADSLHVRSLVP